MFSSPESMAYNGRGDIPSLMLLDDGQAPLEDTPWKTTSEEERFSHLLSDLRQWLPIERPLAISDKIEDEFACIQEGIVILNQNWVPIYINAAYLKIIGQSQKTDIHSSIWELYPAIQKTSLAADMKRAMHTKETALSEFYDATQDCWYENRIYPHRLGICMLGFDINARKRVEKTREAALALAQKRTEESEYFQQQQAEFSDTLCHELRNPLSAAMSSMTLLTEEMALLEDQLCTVDQSTSTETHAQKTAAILGKMKDYLQVIQLCHEQQKVIVNDVLDLSKLESNKIELNPTSFNLQTFIQGIMHMFKAKVEGKKLELIIEAPDLNLWLKADTTRLTQILSNFLDNAIKFTASGSIRIRMHVELLPANESKLNVAIKDTGIGMTSEETSKLFNRFVQANKQTASEYGGSGLGLSIVKKLIEKMGGMIKVESKPGEGTEFSFSVRCCTLSAGEKLALETIRLSPPLPKRLFDLSLIQEKTILVVEDSFVNRKILEQILKCEKYHCEFASNGSEAVEKFKKQFFDVILMDVEMPIMNGIETTKQMRIFEEKTGKHASIIGLSGNAHEAAKKIAYDAGMDDYLSKPYEKIDLYNTIESQNTSLSMGAYFKKDASVEGTMLQPGPALTFGYNTQANSPCLAATESSPTRLRKHV